MVDSDEIVQGEKLQALASITITTPKKLNYMRRYRNASSIRCLVLPGDDYTFSQITDTDVALLAAGDCPSIFVFGDTLASFVRTIAPRLAHRYVLIVHNSDENIDERYRSFLDSDPNLIHLFCQNQVLDHPKASVIPIGIANWQWPHGNADTVAAAHAHATTSRKDRECYVYFNQGTNHAVRQPAWAPARYFGAAQPLPYADYLAHLARHRFCIAPEGNGADTHRFWEALYVGTIPVVLRGQHIAHWERAGVPMVVVDSWEEVTPAFLAAQDYPGLQARARGLAQLHISYWRDLIARRL